MERPVEAPPGAASKMPAVKSPHLICGFQLRSVIAIIICLYFAYSSFAALREQNLEWQHELWTTITWVVWLLLIAGLLSETRCWRERLLFALLISNCILGLVATAWSSIPYRTTEGARELSFTLWIFALVASLSTLRIRASLGEKSSNS